MEKLTKRREDPALRFTAPEGPVRPRPMPAPLRAEMEGSLGMDLAGVKIVELPGLADLGVAAAASVDTVAFGEGGFAPGTREGRALLGHELMHLGQQAQGRVGGGLVNDFALEREADRAGELAASGLPAAPALAPMTPGPAPAEGAIQMKKADKKKSGPTLKKNMTAEDWDAFFANAEPVIPKSKFDRKEGEAYTLDPYSFLPKKAEKGVDYTAPGKSVEEILKNGKYLEKAKFTPEEMEQLQALRENLDAAKKAGPEALAQLLGDMGTLFRMARPKAEADFWTGADHIMAQDKSFDDPKFLEHLLNRRLQTRGTFSEKYEQINAIKDKKERGRALMELEHSPEFETVAPYFTGPTLYLRGTRDDFGTGGGNFLQFWGDYNDTRGRAQHWMDPTVDQFTGNTLTGTGIQDDAIYEYLAKDGPGGIAKEYGLSEEEGKAGIAKRAEKIAQMKARLFTRGTDYASRGLHTPAERIRAPKPKKKPRK